MGKKRIRISSLSIVAVSLAALFIVVALILFRKLNPGSGTEKQPADGEITGSQAAAGEEDEEDEEDYSWVTGPERVNEMDITEGTFVHGDKTFRYNDHLSNYLFLGLDKREFEKKEYGSAEAGQTDSIFLISRDRVTGRTTIVTIPRDTMTKIRKFFLGGEGSVLVEDHLSTAYGYGDGKHGSCDLTREAVSNLLGQIQIRGYCAIALNGLTTLARDVDGVQVTIPDDSLDFKNLGLSEGSEITIDENNIELFLRTRDIDTDNSALFRMGRQKVFIEAFFRRAQEKYKEDPGYLSKTYLDLKQQMVTNMSTDQFAEVFGGISGDLDLEEWTVPGEGVQTYRFDEFRIDPEALLDRMVETFCVEVK